MFGLPGQNKPLRNGKQTLRKRSPSSPTTSPPTASPMRRTRSFFSGTQPASSGKTLNPTPSFSRPRWARSSGRATSTTKFRITRARVLLPLIIVAIGPATITSGSARSGLLHRGAATSPKYPGLPCLFRPDSRRRVRGKFDRDSDARDEAHGKNCARAPDRRRHSVERTRFMAKRKPRVHRPRFAARSERKFCSDSPRKTSRRFGCGSICLALFCSRFAVRSVSLPV